MLSPFIDSASAGCVPWWRGTWAPRRPPPPCWGCWSRWRGPGYRLQGDNNNHSSAYLSLTKRWQLVKEAESPAHDSDRQSVCCQSEDDLCSVLHVPLAKISLLDSGIIVFHSYQFSDKFWRICIVIKFFHCKICWSWLSWAHFLWNKGSAYQTKWVADGVTFQGAVTVQLNWNILHWVFKTHISINVTKKEILNKISINIFQYI